MKEQILEHLKQAREILGTSYIQWTSDNGKGRHCALGAISKATGGIYSSVGLDIRYITDAHCRSLHPELAGATCPRADYHGGEDCFHSSPTMYVNNHLGKEATLQVFDSAILELEIQLAKPEVVVEEGELVTK